MTREALVLISDIRIPTARMRHAPPDVDDLAASIRQYGLLHPITLRQDGKALILVAGYRRLHAMQSLHYGEIPAHIVEATDVEALMIEIDENLQRAELTVLERAQHLAERKRLWESLHPQTRQGAAPGAGQGRGKQPTAASKDPIIGSLEEDPATQRPRAFLDETAARLQRSRAAIHYDVQIATKIPRAAQDLLVGTAAADTQSELLQLARLPDHLQVQVAQLLRDEAAPSVRAAARTLGWAPAPARPPGESVSNLDTPPTAPDRSPVTDDAASLADDVSLADVKQALRLSPDRAAQTIREHCTEAFVAALIRALSGGAPGEATPAASPPAASPATVPDALDPLTRHLLTRFRDGTFHRVSAMATALGGVDRAVVRQVCERICATGAYGTVGERRPAPPAHGGWAYCFMPDGTQPLDVGALSAELAPALAEMHKLVNGHTVDFSQDTVRLALSQLEHALDRVAGAPGRPGGPA